LDVVSHTDNPDGTVTVNYDFTLHPPR
jgi:hypothetical protein